MGKKALFVATVGGFASQFELSNIKLLQKMGYEVHSAANFNDPVYLGKEWELDDLGVIRHQIVIEKSPFMLKANAKALVQLINIIRKEDISLIHCHTPVGGVIGRAAAALCVSKHPTIIYTAHGFHFYKGAPFINWLFYYNIERFMAHFTDCLITINEEDYYAAQNFKIRKRGIVCKIPGEGIRKEAFKQVTEEEKEQLRDKYHIDRDAYFVLSVGELSGNKNHRMIIEHMPDIIQAIPDKKVLYGICGEGFFHEDLSALVREMKLEDNVVLFGYREDVADLLSCADCFLFPSIREGLGMAALEALASGIPVIASDNRGTREYMKNGENGFVCNPFSPQEFVEAIKRIQQMTSEEKKCLIENEQKSIIPFSIDNSQACMKEIYQKMDARISERKLGIQIVKCGKGNECKDLHI